MGIRTPDLLHAIQWQHVHRSPSVQVTVPGRPHQSPGIQAGCCTFVLYSASRPQKSRDVCCNSRAVLQRSGLPFGVEGELKPDTVTVPQHWARFCRSRSLPRKWILPFGLLTVAWRIVMPLARTTWGQEPPA
jgi:hypothetical protein